MNRLAPRHEVEWPSVLSSTNR